MNPGYETFEHGADVGVRGLGRTLEEALVGAARALFSLVVENPEAVLPRREVPVEVEAPTREELLLEWLNRLLSLADLEGLVFAHFSCRVSEQAGGFRLAGYARGEPFDPQRHEPGVEVKGATYTLLRVERRGELWVAQCVVDV